MEQNGHLSQEEHSHDGRERKGNGRSTHEK